MPKEVKEAHWRSRINLLNNVLGEPKDSLKLMEWGGGLGLWAKEYKLSHENGHKLKGI